MKAYTSDHLLPQYANPYHLQETMELIVEGSDCNANTSSAVPSAIIKPIANSSNPASESMVSKIDSGNAGSRVQTVLLPSQAKQAAKSTKSLRQKMKRKQSEKRFFQFPSQSADSSAIRQQSDSCQNSHKAAVSTARQLPLQQDSSCLRRQTTSASSLRELQAQPSRSCQTAVSSPLFFLSSIPSMTPAFRQSFFPSLFSSIPNLIVFFHLPSSIPDALIPSLLHFILLPSFHPPLLSSFLSSIPPLLPSFHPSLLSFLPFHHPCSPSFLSSISPLLLSFYTSLPSSLSFIFPCPPSFTSSFPSFHPFLSPSSFQPFLPSFFSIILPFLPFIYPCLLPSSLPFIYPCPPSFRPVVPNFLILQSHYVLKLSPSCLYLSASLTPPSPPPPHNIGSFPIHLFIGFQLCPLGASKRYQKAFL